MEFFAFCAARATPAALRGRLTIESLPRWCASVDAVLEHDGDSGAIYCVWGRFEVRRERIRDGVRFTLPGCPNALAWTVTAGEGRDGPGVCVHLTINRRDHDLDFVESLRDFVADWRRGLEGGLALD